MKDRPVGLDEALLLETLATEWGLTATSTEYAPLGFGSYHWIVTRDDGARAFVTVDDLDQKGWLGDSRDEVRAALRRAFDAAVALRDLGLDFVVAPTRTQRGDSLASLGPRHTVAVFPFVDGRTAPPDRAVVPLLVELHRAKLDAHLTVRGLALPGRSRLEAALRECEQPWQGGPFSEPARELLGNAADGVRKELDAYDGLAARIDARGADWVVTHGEPHHRNVMHTATGPRLVDWDTVALAPPERDLWMIGEAGSEQLALYAELAGCDVDPDALDLFRRGWDIGDATEYLSLFRSPHAESDDTGAAFEGLTRLLQRPMPTRRGDLPAPARSPAARPAAGS